MSTVKKVNLSLSCRLICHLLSDSCQAEVRYKALTGHAQIERLIRRRDVRRVEIRMICRSITWLVTWLNPRWSCRSPPCDQTANRHKRSCYNCTTVIVVGGLVCCMGGQRVSRSPFSMWRRVADDHYNIVIVLRD